MDGLKSSFLQNAINKYIDISSLILVHKEMTVQADIEKEIPNKNKTIEKLLKINNLYQINIRIETDFFSILFNVVLLTLKSKECKW